MNRRPSPTMTSKNTSLLEVKILVCITWQFLAGLLPVTAYSFRPHPGSCLDCVEALILVVWTPHVHTYVVSPK